MDEPSVTAEDQAQLNTFSRLSETLSIYEPRLAEAQVARWTPLLL